MVAEPGELVEDPLLVGAGDARAVVDDAGHDLTCRRRSTSTTTSIGVPTSVYLRALDSRLVSTPMATPSSASDVHRSRRRPSSSNVRLGSWRSNERDLVARPTSAQSTGLMSTTEAALVELGRPQEGVDQVLEALLLPEHDLVDLRPVVGAELGVAADQRVQEALDRGERRAQLVGDLGDPAVLVVLELLALGVVAGDDHVAAVGQRARTSR